jgi:hypothetical protein
VNAFDSLAESKILEAIAAGELENLPGAGRPLDLADLDGVPEDLRAAYGLLRGANLLPEPLTLHQRRLTLERLLAACTDEAASGPLREELRAVAVQYELWVESRTRRRLPAEYRDRALARLSRLRPRFGA